MPPCAARPPPTTALPGLPAECSDNGLWTQVRAQYQAYNDAYTTATNLDWQTEFDNKTTNETFVSAPLQGCSPSPCQRLDLVLCMHYCTRPADGGAAVTGAANARWLRSTGWERAVRMQLCPRGGR